MKKLTYILPLIILAAASVHGTTVSFTAQQGTAVSNLSGVPLSGTTVELGHWDGAAFSLLGSTSTGNPLPPGLFGGSVLFDSTTLTTVQPAFRIFSDDGGSVVAFSSNWSFSSGDGTGIDFSTDAFDLANVVSGGSLTGTGVLLASAGSTFNLNGAANPTFSSPSLEIGLIPEPSSFALIAGCFGLALAVVRRRSRCA